MERQEVYQTRWSRKLIYPIEPVAKPRMTQRDRWLNPPRKAVQKYRWFCDLVRAYNVELPKSGACITFRLPMPASWSAKKKKAMDGKPHEQVPDWDNLGKALSDAVYGQDCIISDIRIKKVWAKTGWIEIEESFIPNEYQGSISVVSPLLGGILR